MLKVSEEILSLVPYKPGKPIGETQREFGLSHVVKLASNENPLGPSPLAVKAIQERLKEQHRYPDPSAFEFLNEVQKSWGFKKETLAIGNGSNEIIDILIRIFTQPGDKICVAQYSFIAYQICAQAARVGTEFVPLGADFKLNLSAIADKCLADKGIKLVFIPNPNNPTGTYVSGIEVEAFLQKISQRDDLLVVFDEAYNEFVRAKDYKSAQEFMPQYKNLAVIRTLSKVYGLAGLRLGVLAADPFVIDLYNRVRNPFNTNDLAQVAGIAALRDQEFIGKSQNLVWSGLDYFYEKLTAFQLPFIPSQGNFVLIDMGRPAAPYYEALLRKGVIVRPVGNYGLPNHLRVNVGTAAENQEFILALEKVLKEV